MQVFVDESIHDRGDFIVVAVVATDGDIQAVVDQALQESGFTPGQDEFKSSMRMDGNDAAQELRARFKFILNTGCKVAIAICPVSERGAIMSYAAQLAKSMAGDRGKSGGVLHFDGGIRRNAVELPEGWRTVLGCDSRRVAGIQVADCAAHILSTMHLCEMGIVKKTVPTGNIYPDEKGEMEMSWELWASLRYALSSGEPIGGYDDEGWCEPTMKPFGLIVSDACSDDVKAAVTKQFSTVWVGCIH